MTTTSGYLLGASTSERERLLVQGEMFRPEAERLLDQCGIQPGWRAIDVGCGPLGVMDLLSERVGTAGEVVGLDSEPRMLELAKETVAEKRLGNVTLVTSDGGATGLPKGGFDLAHTRLVLMNVPHADAVLGEMVSLVRPGGVVAVQDVDWVSRICEPPHPAWDRIVGVIAELWRLNGMDVHIGRRLPHMLRRAGVTGVGAHAAARVFTHGEPYQRLMVTRAEQCRDALVERGLITGAELDECVRELSAHLDDPGTIVLHATLFQAWGRVPGASR
ncbi:methyltransferase domain-containing protein [Planotetraspora sp. GP83]|uniref:methyltransferase domain-containing protein n=1 Tax=Planotetraspora sp. GP83 TaxID=3156264 RepID=UPI0035178632